MIPEPVDPNAIPQPYVVVAWREGWRFQLKSGHLSKRRFATPEEAYFAGLERRATALKDTP